MYEESTGHELVVMGRGDSRDYYSGEYIEWLEKTLEELLKMVPHNICKIIAETQPVPSMDLNKIVIPISNRCSMYPKEVADCEKTNKSDKEDVEDGIL